MLAGVPVLAANSGGPTETVIDGQTGWLRNVDELDEWTEIFRRVLYELSEAEMRKMGEEGAKRVKEEFSQDTMAQRIDDELEKLEVADRPPVLTQELVCILAVCVASTAVLLWMLFRWR